MMCLMKHRFKVKSKIPSLGMSHTGLHATLWSGGLCKLTCSVDSVSTLSQDPLHLPSSSSAGAMHKHTSGHQQGTVLALLQLVVLRERDLLFSRHLGPLGGPWFVSIDLGQELQFWMKWWSF